MNETFVCSFMMWSKKRNNTSTSAMSSVWTEGANAELDCEWISGTIELHCLFNVCQSQMMNHNLGIVLLLLRSIVNISKQALDQTDEKNIFVYETCEKLFKECKFVHKLRRDKIDRKALQCFFFMFYFSSDKPRHVREIQSAWLSKSSSMCLIIC